MNTSKFAAVTLSLMLSGIGAANALELKGYAIGQEMTQCPDGYQQETGGGFDFICGTNKHHDTLAGKKIQTFHMGVYNGKIISIGASVGRGSSRYSNSELYDAAKARYGIPDREKAHIGEYVWFSGTETLLVDTWKGSVNILDVKAFNSARSVLAQKNKNDL